MRKPNRREAITNSVAGAASVALSESASSLPTACALEKQAPPLPVVDANVHLFHWPFRRLSLDEPRQLERKLQSLGVMKAYAGSFEALLHRDVAGVNRRLADACRESKLLEPVGCVNPTLPDWRDDLRRCQHEHKMRVIRVYPNYHGYTLADESFRELLAAAAAAKIVVQLAVAMEDRRTQHPLVSVADVDLSPLPGIMQRIARARVMLLNYRPSRTLPNGLAECGNVFFDSSRVESNDGLARLMRSVGNDRVAFGSHAPFLIPDAALFRVTEAPIDAQQVKNLLATNIQHFLESE